MEEKTQELPVSTETDSSVKTKESGIADKFSNPEFSRHNASKEPIEKLADAIEAKSGKETEPKSKEELPNKDSSTKSKTPPKESFDLEKWDGKVEALPEKLRKIVTDNQAAYTAKAQEAANLKKELEQIALKSKVEPDAPLFTDEEFAEAQLNPKKFTELVTRAALKIVDQKSQELLPVLNNVRFEQVVAQNEKMINEFAETNPDFWELYEIGKTDTDPGIMQALIDKYKNLEQPYKLMKAYQAKIGDTETAKAQVRIKEKKEASSFGRSANGSEDVIYIEGTKDDALAKQIELSLAGKNVQVRLKNKS